MNCPKPSWRQQAKPLLATPVDQSPPSRFSSLWQAARYIEQHHPSTHSTARREIRRAIHTGHPRYGFHWSWCDTNTPSA